jgi:hypothetical protein
VIFFVAQTSGVHRARIGSVCWRIAMTLSIAAIALAGSAISPRSSLAQDADSQAVDLSNHAFAMLNQVNLASNKAAPMLAPAASLAGDAQTLATALTTHDNPGASSAMASILSDRDKIDAAAKIAAGNCPAEWIDVRQKIAALEKIVPVSKGAGSIASSDAAASAPDSHASVAPPAGETMPVAPKIEIESRVFKGGDVRVKGFLEGTDLKSAGIFDGDTKTRDIEVAGVPGEQRINFDLAVEQPSSSETIRVTDSYGREAQAMVEPDPAGVGAMKGSEELIEVDPGATASPGEAGPIADSPIASAGPSDSDSENTAEIPREDEAMSPSRRHIDANSNLGPLTNVQINVVDAEEVMSAPGNVEVVGQIAGPGVRRAGVYVNGRLAKLIPVSPSGYSAFDLTFPMPAGSDARIRAYGNGNDFVEASIDTVSGGAGMTEYRNPAVYAPYGAYPGYPPPPYYGPNPYAANPYAPAYNPYAPNPYGYPPPYGAPVPANRPWYDKLFH